MVMGLWWLIEILLHWYAQELRGGRIVIQELDLQKQTKRRWQIVTRVEM
jgi:hypothetical protein